jgi:hypothetical protein
VTYTVKVRGAPSRVIAAEYHCEFCGRFELDVERTAEGDAPDVQRCPECNEPSVWCVSSPLARVQKVTAAKHGKSEKPERETWLDTRNIAEGQPLYEFREERAAMWERKRQEDVMRFAKEH